MLFTHSSILAVLATTGLASAFNATHGPLEARRVHHAAAAHHKRIPGRATWYDVGLGACGERNSPGDFIVALNDKQYGSGYPGPHCFEKITIRYKGKSAVATIMDMCPGCPYGALDMSKGLFTHFEGLGAGVFYMDWSFGAGGGGDDGGDDDDKKKDDDDDKKKNDDDDEDKKTSKKPDPPRTTSRARSSTRSRTSSRPTRTSTSDADDASASVSASGTVSIFAAAATPDSNRKPKGGNIGQQWQLIANLGNMASYGRSSDD